MPGMRAVDALLRALRVLDRPAAALALVGVLYAGVAVGLLLDRYEGDVTRFVVAGDHLVDRDAAPPGLHVLEDSDGYDGQYYYRVALDPFTRVPVDFGIRLDAPTYRHQRILYPLLAWALGGGHPDRVPWALLGLNYAGLCALAWTGALLARDAGRHALLGAGFALYPGFALSLARDLTEITAGGLMLAALLLANRGRPRLGAGLLALAVLARETALIASLGALGAAVLARREDGRAAALWLALPPLALYALWQLALRLHWGDAGNGPVMPFGPPLAGFLGLLGEVSDLGSRQERRFFGDLLLLSGFSAAAAAAAWAQRRAPGRDAVAWLLASCLVFSLGRQVWVEDWGYLRAFTEPYLFGALLLLHTPAPWSAGVLLGSWAWWGWIADRLL